MGNKDKVENALENYQIYPLYVSAHMKNGDVIEYQVEGPGKEQAAFEKAYEDFYGIDGDSHDPI